MKRMILLIFCLLYTCMSFSEGMAESTQNIPATIDGGNADRVHLRAEPSIQAKSLGLYFTGTELLCKSTPMQEWTKVVIGSQEGYVKSEYLRWGDDRESVQSKQPFGTIKAQSWVNMRDAPSKKAPIKQKLYESDSVSILGETSEHWSYVQSGDTYGYIMSKFLVIHKNIEAETQFNEKKLYYEQYLAEFPFEENSKAFWGIGTIDAGAAKSVHLRESDNDASQSLGEYYNGTKVICVSDPSETWVDVWIGNTIGSIHSESLCFDTNKSVGNQFEYGEMLEDSILSGDSVSNTTPTFAGDEQLEKGQIITILGRTNDNHYFADSGKGWGYVRCESVKIVNGLSQN